MIFVTYFRLHRLFDDISADDIEIPEEEKSWQNPLLLQQPDRQDRPDRPK